MGYRMMNRNMNLFHAKYALNEMEMKIKLAGKKKKSVKKTEKPSWKEVVKKTYDRDPLEEILEEDVPEASAAAEVQEQAAADENTAAHSGTGAVSGQDTGVNLTKQEITPEKLREAVLWAEILGEPVSRKRQEDRKRRIRERIGREG